LTSRHRHQNATAIQIVKTPVGLISESVRPFVNFKQNRCILDGSGCGGWLRAPSPGILFVAPHPPSPGAVPAPYTPKSPTRHLLMPAEVVLSWTQGLAQPKGPPRGGEVLRNPHPPPIPMGHGSPWPERRVLHRRREALLLPRRAGPASSLSLPWDGNFFAPPHRSGSKWSGR